jgi:D-alanine-D-alanine ligase
MKAKSKIRLALLFGGQSAEHEVSLQSACSIFQAVDKDKYEIILIGIDKNGRWLLFDQSDYLLNANNPKQISLSQNGRPIVLATNQSGRWQLQLESHQSLPSVDIVFPVLHGPYGEDGTIQGFLKLAHIPFVGAGVLGSAVAMDKEVTKRLLNQAGLPTGSYICLKRPNKTPSFQKVCQKLGKTLFIKPANLGSSIGDSKVKTDETFQKAIQNAFRYDNKILIEEYISCREIECSVLGNDQPIASFPGEVIPTHEFYSYEAKYIDPNGAVLKAPAELPEKVVTQIQSLAVKAFKALGCEGMARVDMFLKPDGMLLINELNTIPGFTKISMYPKLWEASGLPYPKLIDRLIELGLERFEREQRLKTTYQ